MSNLIFNLRIGYWHFQIMRDRPWVRVAKNHYLASAEHSLPSWIELYR